MTIVHEHPSILRVKKVTVRYNLEMSNIIIDQVQLTFINILTQI